MPLYPYVRNIFVIVSASALTAPFNLHKGFIPLGTVCSCILQHRQFQESAAIRPSMQKVL